MATQTVGFVGVGRMGGRMARRLIQAGFRLTIYDTSDAAIAPLVELGANRVESASAVGAAEEIVFVSLPTPQIVNSVVLGHEGIAEGGKVKVIVDTSTTGAPMTARVAEGLAAKGITLMGCPISGGVGGAEKGTLALMVSGPKEILPRLQPMLDQWGKTFYIGEKPAMAQTMKLLNNLLSATAVAISSEAMVMGVKAGLDPQMIVDVINSGTGKNSATDQKIPKFVIPRTFNCGFALALMTKDVRLCLEEADALGIPMIVGTAVRQLMAITSATEGGGADLTEMVKPVERWAGVRVGEK